MNFIVKKVSENDPFLDRLERETQAQPEDFIIFRKQTNPQIQSDFKSRLLLDRRIHDASPNRPSLVNSAIPQKELARPIDLCLAACFCLAHLDSHTPPALCQRPITIAFLDYTRWIIADSLPRVCSPWGCGRVMKEEECDNSRADSDLRGNAV